VRIAVVYYSMYGHIATLAKSIVKGIEAAGGEAKLFQVPETLSEEVLGMMHAPPKDASVPVFQSPDELDGFDGIIFGTVSDLKRFYYCAESGRSTRFQSVELDPLLRCALCVLPGYSLRHDYCSAEGAVRYDWRRVAEGRLGGQDCRSFLLDGHAGWRTGDHCADDDHAGQSCAEKLHRSHPPTCLHSISFLSCVAIDFSSRTMV
jgi:hypothetical protein